jgi:lipid A ethanolaminephosphotransferase
MNLLSKLRSVPRVTLSRLWILVISALWISLVPNLASIESFAASDASGEGVRFFTFVAGGWAIVLGLVLATLAAFSILFPGRAVRWWCAIAIVISAILGYHSYAFGVQFDKTMLINILATHSEEAFELVTWRMIAWVVFVGFIPAIAILWVRAKATTAWWRHPAINVSLIVIPIVVALFVAYLQLQRYAAAVRERTISFHTVAPVNLVGATVSLMIASHAETIVREHVGLDAKVGANLAKPRLLVFVLGETARAQSQSLNGYAKDTNPRMIAERVINFPFTESCGTATSFSVPCMFSGFTLEEFSIPKALSRETLVDVIATAGVKVWWRDNDSGCKGVCDRVDVIDVTYSTDPRFCPKRGNCYDEILLDGLEAKIQKETGNMVVFLHLKGSHGPAYYRRYPKAFERFTPTCKTSDLSSCTNDALRNAYDNTILYSDHVKGEVVEMLKRLSPQFATMMFYASDHGESLGERGLYLHGLPYAFAPEEQTRVPMFAWFSPQYLELEKLSETCMRRQSRPGMKHDHIYSTVLGLLDIQTELYKPERDIFAECHKEASAKSPAATTPSAQKLPLATATKAP